MTHGRLFVLQSRGTTQIGSTTLKTKMAEIHLEEKHIYALLVM